jgi:hypothetical protein
MQIANMALAKPASKVSDLKINFEEARPKVKLTREQEDALQRKFWFGFAGMKDPRRQD